MKVRFAHQLRAIAALSVVINHFWGIFFSPGVRGLIGTPASFVPVRPAYTQHVLSPAWGGFLYGAFGVAVFFLISGFVIPISLRNISTGQFLARRFFRIYPVYWFCLLISIAMYFICSWYWSTPLSDRISTSFLARNIPLIHSASGLPSLDFVSWSLAVELKFYVIFALVSVAGKSAHQVMRLSIGFMALCCVVAFFSTHGMNSASLVSYAVSDMKFISFMFLGCLFYYVLYRELSAKVALGYGAIVYALFVTINSFYETGLFGALTKNYTYALMLFSLCYLFRGRFKQNRMLDFLADISFPLYLVHSMIGYVAMPILISKGLSFTFAWMISLGVAVLVAFLVHRYVEIPANNFGKKLSGPKESRAAEYGRVA
ncbi:acyltransferase family protein [Dyella kyungheensis]|uniref:Acyltransferase n=1 Tax=Dyella kyungheensis TaxID=1242174 RepID=A0ABS2JQ45_9GAMM|nr:acyltransferase [Dyella kyungheensis]MBM7121151.1 acyltransferase [Dyella kyungheensis]